MTYPVSTGRSARALSQDCTGDRAPPGRIDPPHVDRKALANDQCWQRIEIHFVDVPIYDEIAHHTEYDQKVQAEIEEAIVKPKRKTANGRVHEPAGCDEYEPTMEFGPFPPIDGERNDHAKGDHVVERDRHKSLYAALMELNGVKSGHDDGCGNAQRHHHRGQPGPKPAEEAMPAHFVYTDQRGLSDEEGHPRCECGAVNPEKQGPRHGGVEEAGADRTAEAPYHKRGDQQRHEEIEVSFQKPSEPGHLK